MSNTELVTGSSGKRLGFSSTRPGPCPLTLNLEVKPRAHDITRSAFSILDQNGFFSRPDESSPRFDETRYGWLIFKQLMTCATPTNGCVRPPGCIPIRVQNQSPLSPNQHDDRSHPLVLLMLSDSRSQNQFAVDHRILGVLLICVCYFFGIAVFGRALAVDLRR